MKKIFILLINLFLLFNFGIAKEKTNPFSKIEITSNKAIGKKDNNQENILIFTYLENVNINFADNSTAKCKELTIELDTKKKSNPKEVKITQKNIDLGPITKITLNKNILISQANRKIKADNAIFLPNKKICNLSGNIEIKQEKNNSKDLPITTKCNKATLNLETDQVLFEGKTDQPVSTIISLQNYPSLIKTNNRKKHLMLKKKNK